MVMSNDDPYKNNRWNAPLHGSAAFTPGQVEFRKDWGLDPKTPSYTPPGNMSGASNPLTVGSVTFGNNRRVGSGGYREPVKLVQLLIYLICIGLPIYLGVKTQNWWVGIGSLVAMLGLFAKLSDILDDDIGDIIDNVIIATVSATVLTVLYLNYYTSVTLSWKGVGVMATVWAVALSSVFAIHHALMRKRKYARAVHIVSRIARFAFLIGIAAFVVYELRLHGVI
jgi:hypothetical protein